MRNFFLFISFFFFLPDLMAQVKDTIDGRLITLSEVVVRNNTDVKGFVNRVKLDTSFYKAFKNLRVLEFTAYNDIRMFDKKGKLTASLNGQTRQERNGGCRFTRKLSEQTTGDFYNEDGEYNYYTASLYSSLFWAFKPICGETNVVKGVDRNLRNKSGMEKHKEQLKMLFFNPGMKIPGIPLMGDKAALFDNDMSKWYNFSIDIETKSGKDYYVFSAEGKSAEEGGDADNLVIDKMTTWFDYQTMDVVSRTYALSYSAGVYSFNVYMEVDLSRYKTLLVPTVIRYNGEWRVFPKQKERGVFTATLTDFGGR